MEQIMPYQTAARQISASFQSPWVETHVYHQLSLCDTMNGECVAARRHECRRGFQPPTACSLGLVIPASRRSPPSIAFNDKTRPTRYLIVRPG